MNHEAFQKRFSVMITIMIIIVFVMFVFRFIEENSCVHPRYVRGMECYDNGDRTFCKEAMVYDGCDDQ